MIATIDDSSLLMRAVLAGQGAGLLPAAMVAPDVAEGRLVKLSDVTWLEDFAYFLVYPEAHHNRPKIAAFRTWTLNAASPAAKVVQSLPTAAG
jgi:LysR family glycine cleavage system transcriptional activator